MADHPLRPATDQSLGRPLPHQLANPTRAPPAAINLSPDSPRAYAVLAEVSLGYPPQQGRFPRVTHPCATPLRAEAPRAFDLHVLGMPPAFVLSQDQTLMFIPGPPHQSPAQLAPIRQPPWRDPYQGRQTLELKMRERPATPRRRPRIPSSSPTMLNQQSPPPRHLARRARLYPPLPDRQHPLSAHILAEAGAAPPPERRLPRYALTIVVPWTRAVPGMR